MNRSLQQLLVGLLCSHLVISCDCRNETIDPSKNDPSTSGPAIDPTTGDTDLKNPSPHYHGVSFIFIKGDCGHDEYTCENVGEPGHGHYEIYVAPGITLRDKLKMLEEQEKQEDEKHKQELEISRKQIAEQAKRNQKFAKEAQEHDLKFKNGKIFIPERRTSRQRTVKRLFDIIEDNIGYFDDQKASLDEACKQNVSKIFNIINQELKEIQEEIGGIEKCLNMTEKSPRINYEREKNNLVLAKQLVKDLEKCKEELCTLLAARRKELNNPELEAAYKEVEQRKGGN